MLIPSTEIPQADVLDDVVKVAKAVYNGATTFQEIAGFFKKVERQGRYYRLAAEILGLIHNDRNHAMLTPIGKRLVHANKKERIQILRSLIMKTRLFQRVIAFLEIKTNGVTKQELQAYISEVTEPVGPSMLPRRVSTTLSWLTVTDMLRESEGKYFLSSSAFQNLPVTEFKEISEPILPKTGRLDEYRDAQIRTQKAEQEINFTIDMVKRERANSEHRKLINFVANQIKKIGAIPRANQLIDLASRIDSASYIFEMKSLTESNARSQIRHGISQLYEYRYLQNSKDSILVLVLEKELPSTERWMQDYLESDRNIKVVWDGNNKLYASKKTQDELRFLWR